MATPRTHLLLKLQKLFASGALNGNSLVYARDLDTAPRCRPNGLLVDVEEEENEAIWGERSTSSMMHGGGGWIPARRVMQLRWTVLVDEESIGGDARGEDDVIRRGCFSKGALLDHTTLAIRCVQVLQQLCRNSASRDARGSVVRPLPKPRRVLSEPSNLTHLVQVSGLSVCMCRKGVGGTCAE